MALTRDFKETVKKRVDCDPDFAKALLHEAIDLMLDGERIEFLKGGLKIKTPFPLEGYITTNSAKVINCFAARCLDIQTKAVIEKFFIGQVLAALI